MCTYRYQPGEIKVLTRLDAVELLGEDRERALDRRLDDCLVADRRRLRWWS